MIQRAAVHRDSHTTQDGNTITLVKIGAGLVGLSTRRSYVEGQWIDIEPDGPRWRAVEAEEAQ